MPPTTAPARAGLSRALVPQERLSWVDKQYRTLDPLSREEEGWLIPMAQEGDEVAADRVIRANVRFAAQVAVVYARKYRVPEKDLIAAAVAGLWIALGRFEVERGLKFISHAVWWVRSQIEEQAPLLGAIVRRPQHARAVDTRFYQRRDRLEQEAGGAVDDVAVLEEIEIYGGYVPPITIWSLDRDIDNGGAKGLKPGSPANRTLHETVAGEDGEEAVFAALTRDELRTRLQAFLSNQGCWYWSCNKLDAREHDILTAYFGLGGAPPLTLEQIGAQMGLTRERVRQIKEQALAKLKLRINGHRAELMELVEG